jgi:hypothetical protein
MCSLCRIDRTESADPAARFADLPRIRKPLATLPTGYLRAAIV